MATRRRLLMVVSDEGRAARLRTAHAVREGFVEVHEVVDARGAHVWMNDRGGPPSCVLVEVDLRRIGSELPLVAEIRRQRAAARVVCFSEHHCDELSSALLIAGAYDCLSSAASPSELVAAFDASPAAPPAPSDSMNAERLMVNLLARTMIATGGNQSQAAKLMGMDRNTVSAMLKRGTPRPLTAVTPAPPRKRESDPAPPPPPRDPRDRGGGCREARPRC